MADRGRKAHPVANHICEERWRAKEQQGYRQRLSKAKAMVDNAPPEALKFKLDAHNNPKRRALAAQRQEAIDTENKVLLEKLVKIRSTDSAESMRPFLGRSTFQWGPGKYYDPSTNLKCVDHTNLTMYSSPRSIHHHQHVRNSGMQPYAEGVKSTHLLLENSRLLRNIHGVKSVYDVGDMEAEHDVNQERVLRLSQYRGPPEAYYMPSAARGSQSRPTSPSPYLSGGPIAARRPQRPQTAAVHSAYGSPVRIPERLAASMRARSATPSTARERAPWDSSTNPASAMASRPGSAARTTGAASVSRAASARSSAMVPDPERGPPAHLASGGSSVASRVEYRPPSQRSRAHPGSTGLSRAGSQAQAQAAAAAAVAAHARSDAQLADARSEAATAEGASDVEQLVTEASAAGMDGAGKASEEDAAAATSTEPDDASAAAGEAASTAGDEGEPGVTSSAAEPSVASASRAASGAPEDGCVTDEAGSVSASIADHASSEAATDLDATTAPGDEESM